MATATATTMKPLAILKRFFAPKATLGEMQTMIAGFSRPLRDDESFVWLVNESARALGLDVDWAS